MRLNRPNELILPGKFRLQTAIFFVKVKHTRPNGRQGRRHGGLSVSGDHRLLGLYRAGAGQQGEGSVPRQCRRRHRQLHQAGARIRAAAERREIAALVYQDYIARSVGLELAQGIVGAMPFYWDMNDDFRAFAARFTPRYHNARPNYYHAGSYSAVWHYLKAVAAMGPDKAKASGKATVEQMKALPVADPLYGTGTVRADGKFIHANRVWQTKTPAS